MSILPVFTMNPPIYYQLGSGPSGEKHPVEVQVLSSALKKAKCGVGATPAALDNRQTLPLSAALCARLAALGTLLSSCLSG